MILTNFQLEPNLAHFPSHSKSCNRRENTLNKTQMVKTPNNQPTVIHTITPNTHKL